jgi:hypothetical protein
MTTIAVDRTPIELASTQSLAVLREAAAAAEREEIALRARLDQAQAARKHAVRAFELRKLILARDRARRRAHISHGISVSAGPGDRTWTCGKCGTRGTLLSSTGAIDTVRASAAA